MYGIVNQDIKSMITNKYGTSVWQKILDKSGVGNVFEVAVSYPDIETFKLFNAMSSVFNVKLSDVLTAYGKWWIHEYSTIVTTSGHSFIEFIENLAEHHSKVSYIMPNLAKPAFEIVNEVENSFDLKYSSMKKELNPFVIGLIEGLGKHYNMVVDIRQKYYDLFHIEYTNMLEAS